MTQTDTQPGIQTTPRTGDQIAQTWADDATQAHEQAAAALEPTAHQYGPEATPLDAGTADYDATTDVLSDYWERTDQAASDNDGVSGNQDVAYFQPPTGTIADPNHLDDPDARIDPADPPHAEQQTQNNATGETGETSQQPQQGPTGPSGETTAS
jgi:hypothetical protein